MTDGRTGHDEDRVAAYALDALPADERADFEAHLTSCSTCQAELAELREVVDVLPLAVAEVEPPAALRGRIVAAATSQTPRPTRLSRLTVPAGLLVAAAAVIAALGLWNLSLQQQLHNREQALAFQRQVEQAIAQHAAVYPVSGTSAAPAASAALIQPRRGRPAYLIVQGLPATPARKVYQLWLIHGATPDSAGTFTYAGSGPQVVHLPLAAAGYAAAAVTVEPGPRGSRAPTGQKVLIGRLGA